MKTFVNYCAALLALLLAFPAVSTAVDLKGANATISTATPYVSPTWPASFSLSAGNIRPTVYPASYGGRFTCMAQVYKPENPDEVRPSFDLHRKSDCGTDSGTDLYGWGVRLGFYLSWFGSIFASVFPFFHKEINNAINANSIFLLALEITVVKYTFIDDGIQRFDAVILYLIGTGTTVGAMSIWGTRTTIPRTLLVDNFGRTGTILRLLLCICHNIYAVWFWYSPLKRIGAIGNCDPRCWAVYIFGHKLQSGIRWLFFTFSLIWLIYWSVGLIISGLFLLIDPSLDSQALYYKFVPAVYKHDQWKGKTCLKCGARLTNSVASDTCHNDGPDNDKDTVDKSQSQQSLSRPQRLMKWLRENRRSLILPFSNLLWFILLIAAIEKTLHQNSSLDTLLAASESTSPAQLVPFLVGVFTILTSFGRGVFDGTLFSVRELIRGLYKGIRRPPDNNNAHQQRQQQQQQRQTLLPTTK